MHEQRTEKITESIVRILFIEDMEADFELAKHKLKQEGIRFDAFRVEDEAGLRKALVNFKPHIILSDYNLPQFNGMKALKIVQSEKLDIPFVVLTGSLNEEIAVECMKAGASDYLIKEHIKRLAPALINALEHKEVRTLKEKTENDLIQSELRFHRLADNMPDMIYRIRMIPKRKFEYVNLATETITGYTAEELYEDSDLGNKIIHEEDIEVLERKIQSGEYFFKPIVVRLVRKDGKVIWIEQRNIPIFDNIGTLVAIEGVAQDISEKKNLEILKQAIFNIAQATNTTKSLNELYLEVHHIISDIMPANNFFIALYDQKNDIISFPYYVDEYDLPPMPRKPKKGFTEFVINSGEPLLCDRKYSELLQNNGTVEPIGKPHEIWLGVPLKFDEKTIGMMAVQHYSDTKAYSEKEKSMLEYVSTQVAKAIIYKQAEDQILKLSIAVEQSPVSIIITNVDGLIEYANTTFCELTGYTRDEVYGKNPRILKSGNTNSDIYPTLWATILKGQTWQGEFINKKKNGEIYIENTKISPIIGADGKIQLFVAVKEDITEKKNKERELIEAKEKAQESDMLKTAFLHNLSHEIRTPMNAIVGFSELIEYEIGDQEKIQYYTKVLKQRSDDLLNIINDLLDIARVEADQVNIRLEPFDLQTFISELHTDYTEQHNQTEKSFINLIKKDVPEFINSVIESDRGKLKQVFTNLINNAYKFTNSGSIEFGFHSVTNDNITFYVADTGVGISKSTQEIIFERFRKLADESVYTKDGLGLGLAIVRGMLKVLGGRIWVESELKKGSTFYFSIPYHPIKHDILTEKPLKKKKEDVDWSNHTILIVEDDSFNVAYFIELLQDTKIDYSIATTGEKAKVLFASMEKIDLVLMDIKLPDANGYELTKIFKQQHPNIPIIAQTAFASDADRLKALNAGCNDFISKPITRAKLVEILNKYLKQN